MLRTMFENVSVHHQPGGHDVLVPNTSPWKQQLACSTRNIYEYKHKERCKLIHSSVTLTRVFSNRMSLKVMLSKHRQDLHHNGRETVPEVGRNRHAERTHLDVWNTSMIAGEGAHTGSHEALKHTRVMVKSHHGAATQAVGKVGVAIQSDHCHPLP